MLFILLSIAVHGQSYEVPITLPQYNPEDPTMVLIETNEDWNMINNPDKTYFFVTPGDYTALGEIEISTPGTAETPRWLVYYNPENSADLVTHPVDMSADQRAEFERIELSGSHWIVDRLYGTATAGSKNPTLDLHGANIIVNRMLCEGGGGGAGQVAINASNIVVQNSVMRNTQIIPNSDIHGMKISGGFDVRIVNNEIYNFAGDGVQLGDKPESFKGVIIYNNDFYIDLSLYPEEVDEIPHENAIDIKQAGVPGGPQNYVLIKNNRFRNIAHTPGGTSPNPDQGTIDFSNKNDPKSHVLVEGNVFYDCKIPFNTKGGGQTSNFTITKNLIYNATRFGVWMDAEETYNHEITFNTIIGVAEFNEDQEWLNTKCQQLEVYGNLILNGGGISIPEANYKSDYNVFFNTTFSAQEGSHSIVLESINASDFEDYCYPFKMHTNPETLCIPGARPTQSAAFTNLTATQYFGETAGVGVNDQSYNQDWVGALSPAHVTGFPSVDFQYLPDTLMGVVNIEVLATDEDNDLAGVQLFLDGEALGELIENEPYTYSWDTKSLTDGSYTLKALATDQAGNTTYSNAITRFLDNTPDSPPVVALTTPEDGATVANEVILTATASDPDGDLVGVQFILEGAGLGAERFSAPFERVWFTKTVPDGSYQLWAVARDMGGREFVSDVVNVTVDNSYPPLVSIVNIVGDSILTGDVEILAEVSDVDDDVTSVEFLAGDQSIGTVTEAPYSLIWGTKDFENGEYKLVAIATDSDGNVVPSRAVSIEVFNHVLEVTLRRPHAMIFPNPASEYFMVGGIADHAAYAIYSIHGKIIAEGLLQPHQPVDISGIPDGVYMVLVGTQSGEQVTIKMIKSGKNSF